MGARSAILEAYGDAADFLKRPSHQRCSLASSAPFWGGSGCWRAGAPPPLGQGPASPVAHAATNHGRSGFRGVRPNSVLAVAKASSISQRWPSSRTWISMGGRTLGREERQILIRDGSSDQQTACPYTGEVFLVLIRPGIRQLDTGPVIQARTPVAVARRQASPNLRGTSLRAPLDRAGDFGFADPEEN
jgi:hypothetical protein